MINKQAYNVYLSIPIFSILRKKLTFCQCFLCFPQKILKLIVIILNNLNNVILTCCSDMEIEIGSESQCIQAAKLFIDWISLLCNWVVIANVHWALNG